NVFIAKLGWMSIMGYMIFIIIASFFVHFSRIPITLSRNSLRAPVRPYSKLGVAEPFRVFVLFKRFFIGFEHSVAYDTYFILRKRNKMYCTDKNQRKPKLL